MIMLRCKEPLAHEYIEPVLEKLPGLPFRPSPWFEFSHFILLTRVPYSFLKTVQDGRNLVGPDQPFLMRHVLFPMEEKSLQTYA